MIPFNHFRRHLPTLYPNHWSHRMSRFCWSLRRWYHAIFCLPLSVLETVVGYLFLGIIDHYGPHQTQSLTQETEMLKMLLSIVSWLPKLEYMKCNNSTNTGAFKPKLSVLNHLCCEKVRLTWKNRHSWEN